MNWNYYHQLSPFLLQITDNVGLRWYSMAYILGILVAYYFAFIFVKQGRFSLSKEKILDLMTYGAFGVILGGRLGYCLFYSPYLFLSIDSSFPFWGVLKIHQGGMASHGGIFGLFVSLWIFSRVHKISFFSLVDLAALGGAVGIFLGRIANFINGELYGRVIEGTTLLAVKFPDEIFLWLSDVTKYQEKLIALGGVMPRISELVSSYYNIPSASTWKEWILKASEDNYFNSGTHYITSLIVDKSSDPQIRSVLEPLLSFRHPSQLYQSLFGGLIPFLIILVVWFKNARAGFISSIWIFCYIFARFITEFFRMPDVHIGYQWLSFTRGQWLSISFLALAIFYTWFVFKQKPAA